MIRLSMVMLGLMVCGAAAGRYEAETAVRKAEAEIRRLEARRAAEVREIQVLRTEVAHLERPQRLADYAREFTDLRPVRGDQLMTADDFALAFGIDPGADPLGRPAPSFANDPHHPDYPGAAGRGGGAVAIAGLPPSAPIAR